jgi:hypothetical protein
MYHPQRQAWRQVLISVALLALGVALIILVLS